MKLGVEVEGAWSVLMKPGSINIPREFRTNLIRLFKLIKFEMGGWSCGDKDFVLYP